MGYEYRVLPAPSKGLKDKGAKTTDARYAAALAQVLNAEAANGWEFLRAEVMPCEERQGLTGSKTVFANVLIFRRDIDDAADAATEEAIRLIGHAADTPRR